MDRLLEELEEQLITHTERVNATQAYLENRKVRSFVYEFEQHLDTLQLIFLTEDFIEAHDMEDVEAVLAMREKSELTAASIENDMRYAFEDDRSGTVESFEEILIGLSDRFEEIYGMAWASRHNLEELRCLSHLL